MDSERQRAERDRVPYLEPVSLFGDGRAVRVPSPLSLQESYETQLHVVDDRGRVLRSGRLLPPPAAHSYEPLLLQLVSAWNPHGVPSTLAENLARDVELAEAVADLGGEVLEVVATMPPDRAWVEDTLVVRGLAPDTVRELARSFGQPAWSLVGFDSITVAPTGLSDDVHLVTLECDEVPLTLDCPMRTEHTGETCRRRGGPWVSESRLASAIWSTHRQLLLERTGCATCGDGSPPTAGPLGRSNTVVGLERLRLASRYGGYACSPAGS